jgi:hypothetical protein
MDEHPGDDLDRLLDGSLGAERAAQVEAHLAACARCRRELEALRAVQSALRDHLPRDAVPDHVADRVRAAVRRGASPRAAFPLRRAAAAAAVLAAAAVVVLLIARPRDGTGDIVAAVAADFVAYRSGDLRLQRSTTVPDELERFFRAEGVPFPTVFDFSGMEFRLAGGSVHRDGRLRTLFAYEGPGDDRLLCQMYGGTTAELTGAPEVRHYDGVEFFVYRVDDLTLVFWQDGRVVCVLVMDGDPERAIAFARAKAGGA